jgi:microcystin-dependent protein
MNEPFIGEIRIFPLDFVPRGWLPCDGRTLAITENAALFSVLGTRYGGDGRDTFALPDLQGRSPLQAGQGPGLTAREMGETGGSGRVALEVSQMPAHTHAVETSTDEMAGHRAPSSERRLALSHPGKAYGPPGRAELAPEALGSEGDSLEHENRMPYLTLRFCIAAHGTYPNRG